MKYLILALLLSFSAQAAVKKKSQFELNKLRKEFKVKKKSIKGLGLEISSLEKSLVRRNRKYLRTFKRRRKIEAKLQEMKEGILSETASLKRKITETKGLLRQVILSEIAGGDSFAELALKEDLKVPLVKKIKSLNHKLVSIKNMQSDLSKLEKRMTEFLTIENELVSIIRDLESVKNEKARNYINSKKEIGQLGLILRESKISKKSIKKKVSLRKKYGVFMPPIKGHDQIEYKKGKGVNFLYTKRQAVFASRSGKLVHSGPLGAFGNVVIIGHGQQLKSVIVGDFISKRAKGDFVSKGDIVGYTSAPSGNKGQIYFEVRKKDKAQKTIHLLDNKLLAQNVGHMSQGL